jgi:hypothetical protein
MWHRHTEMHAHMAEEQVQQAHSDSQRHTYTYIQTYMRTLGNLQELPKPHQNLIRGLITFDASQQIASKPSPKIGHIHTYRSMYILQCIIHSYVCMYV